MVIRAAEAESGLSSVLGSPQPESNPSVPAPADEEVAAQVHRLDQVGVAGEGPQLGTGRGRPVVAGGGDGVPAPEFGGAVLEADHDVRQVRFRRQRPPEF